MSFFSDLFSGNTGNLGHDLTAAPESLAKHPSELYETLGGVAAAATGGLALGGLGALGLGGEAAAGAGGLFSGADAAGGAAGGALPFADASGASSAALFDPTTWGAGADAAIPSTATSTVGDSSLVNGVLGLNPADPSLLTNASAGGANGGILTGGDALGVSPDAFAAQPSLAGDAAGTPPTGTTPASGTGTNPAQSPWQQFKSDPLGTLGNGAVKSLTSNPLGVAAGVGGLGYAMYQGQKTNGNVQAMENQAQAQAIQGQNLESYIQSGQLPAGLAAQMKMAIDSNKARIMSNYAAQGQSTDPTKNSALAQDLNTVDMQAQAMQGQIATQLLTSGQSAVNMSDQLYQALAQIDMTQAQNMGKAIASFSASLAGKTATNIGGVPVTVG